MNAPQHGGHLLIFTPPPTPSLSHVCVGVGVCVSFIIIWPRLPFPFYFIFGTRSGEFMLIAGMLNIFSALALNYTNYRWKITRAACSR